MTCPFNDLANRLRNGMLYLGVVSDKDVRDAITALEHASALVHEWRPIETAPKDGTPDWNYTDSTEVMVFCPSRGGRSVDWIGTAYWTGRGWYAGEACVCPTHWMPLPAPPEWDNVAVSDQMPDV